jgi:hypothetical protein
MMAYRNKKNANILKGDFGLDSLSNQIPDRDRSSSKKRIQISNTIGRGVSKDKKSNEGSFPDNYGYYAAKSSMFSKVGTDIIGKSRPCRLEPGISFKENKTSIGNVIDDLIQNMNNNMMPVFPVMQNNEDVAFNADEEVLSEHLIVWDLMMDLELNVDNKVYLKNVVKKLTNYINETNVKNCPSDMFSSGNLSKGYIKLIKIMTVLLIFLNFVILDFNYEANVKMNIKKIILNLNEYIITIIDNYVHSDKLTDLFKEKLKKVSKNHKIKKTKEFIPALTKNLDLIITNMKQFSK